MGQKKRSSAPRSAVSSISSSNGTFLHPPPPSDSVSFQPIRSLVPLDVELSRSGSVNGVNIDENVRTNGVEHAANGGGPGISKGLEVSKTCQEDLSNVKSDCEKALVALRRGNSNKALRLIRDACVRYEGNALVQRIRGHICMRLASMIEDLTTKQRHLKDAIDAAQKAVLLSPCSVEYAQFHAQLLFEAATDSKGYEEVVQECQRALEIEDPVDPAKESLHEEGQHKSTTAEARIQLVQQELRNLVQKANIASISNWMKTLGTGGNEEKLRFIHMRKLVDDPMEQRISQPKRPHEVKKSVKTAEEKRKDIEVRVAAARLLQQKRDCSPPHSDDGSSKPTKGTGRIQRRKSAGVNYKKLNQAQSVEEKIERLKPFWNSLSPEKREKMLEIPLNAFKQQFTLLKPNVTSELLTEALEFAQGRKTWRFWMCWNCGEKCTEYQEHAEHITEKHIEGLPTKLRRLFPLEVDHGMADQILDEDCRPFDGLLAMKLLIGSHEAEIDLENPQSQQESSVTTAPFDCLSDEVTTSVNSSLDSSGDPSNSELFDIGGNSTQCITSDNADGKVEEQVRNSVSDGKCENLKTVVRINIDTKGHEFPYSDDDERTKLLQKIYNLLRILLRNKCLAADHMEKIMQYAHDELKNFIPASPAHYEFNTNLFYVRFLPALQLRRVLSYLRELANACGLDQQLDTGLPESSQNEEDVILDRLFLNEDLTILSLDERLLKETLGKAKEVVFGTGNENTVKQHIHNNEMEPQLPLMTMKDGGMASHADMQLSWIYGTAEYEYQPAVWKQYRETRAQQGREIFREMEKEFLSLQSLCEKKHEQIHVEAAVNMAEALCVEELKKRESKEDGVLSCHDAVLRKRKHDLLECRETGLSSQQKLELEVITSMLRDARTVNLRQFPYDSSITLTSAHLSDSDEEVEDAWRVPDFVPQPDSHIELAIQWKKDRCTSEVNKLDARILRSMDTIQRLEHKLGNASVLDYRSVVLPLVKTFLKTQLEEAAEKDAMQKSEAAREAFLAELSRDGKATVEKLPDSARPLKEKSKDKKKNKEQKRSKDGKQGSAAVAAVDPQQSLTRLVADSENADEDGLEWELDEAQQLIEAELKRQAEVEDEERKLAETLELQRRIEEEAKEKHLAELRKKNAEVEMKIPIQLQGNFEDIQNGTHNIDCESIFSTSIKESDHAGSLPSSSVLMNIDVCKDVSSTGDGSVFADNDNLMASSSDLVVLPHSEPHDSGSSRPKRSGKHRRKRLSRASHEDNHINTNGEQSFISGLEQTKSVMDHDVLEYNATLEGVKPLETGSILTTNSRSTTERKQNGEKDEVNVERIEYPSDHTLRQLKADQDAEERFQADLEQAMRQSLANAAEYSSLSSEIDLSTSSDIIATQKKRNISEEVGKGLQNEIGQYNCFLNVVIQSLWHLQRFREELLDDSSSHHVHMGDPCVVCALREIFVGLNSPSSDSTKEIVAPTTLRIALSNLSSQKDFFQEAQMNDASEVLAVVFECIHKAFATNSVLSDGDSDTGSGVGFWECHDNLPCIAHSLFALDIARQMNCTKCGLESRHLKYTTFFHNINANSLRTAKILYQENSLDELLRLVEMNEFLACDVEMGGCGQQNYIHYLLRAAPHVFITVLGWQNCRESFEDISATMDAIAVDMDVGIVYCGLDSGFRHRLVSVICYYGQHYHCFAFNHEIGRWVMFDDTTVKVIGTYEDVVDTCRRGHLQPQVLFYEASQR